MPRPCKHLAVAALTAFLCSCSTVGSIVDIIRGESPVEAAFRLSDPAELPALLDELARFDVETIVQEVETGSRIVRIVGVYTELQSALTSVVAKGVSSLLANTELAGKLLAFALKAAS